MTYDPDTLPPPKIPEAPLVLLSSNVRVSLKIASRPSDAAVVARPCRARRADRTRQNGVLMKPGIHPDYHPVTVHSACAPPFPTPSPLPAEMLPLETSSR